MSLEAIVSGLRNAPLSRQAVKDRQRANAIAAVIERLEVYAVLVAQDPHSPRFAETTQRAATGIVDAVRAMTKETR